MIFHDKCSLIGGWLKIIILFLLNVHNFNFLLVYWLTTLLSEGYFRIVKYSTHTFRPGTDVHWHDSLFWCLIRWLLFSSLSVARPNILSFFHSGGSTTTPTGIFIVFLTPSETLGEDNDIHSEHNGSDSKSRYWEGEWKVQWVGRIFGSINIYTHYQSLVTRWSSINNEGNNNHILLLIE